MKSAKPVISEQTSWSVVNELGIEYLPQNGIVDSGKLLSPVYAAQASDGTYLIVDQVCAEKPIPFRMEYRTIRVDTDGQIVYDTMQEGIEDGFGCVANGDSMAILRPTKWELLLVSREGRVTDRIDLTAFSKHMPRSVSWTHDDTFLIGFHDRARRLDIVEVDRQGRMLWFLPPEVDYLGMQASVQLLPTNNLLVADSIFHSILEIDRAGNVMWQFGKAGEPAKTPDRVSGATCARELADGRRLISDTRNHRLLMVNADGSTEEVGPPGGQLSDPTYAEASQAGNLLICDSGNSRVIELDGQRIVWQYGSAFRQRRHFSFPRSVEVNSAGEYLIADTANDRIVKSSPGGQPEKLACSEMGLFWPRCVRWLPSGSLLIADARRGRIIELGEDGQVLNQLSEVKWQGCQKLQDPHDVRMLPNGHLLITDSPQDAIFEVDWSGEAHRVVGCAGTVDLSDPHSAQQLDDGRIVICDTGHHRIVFVDERGACVDAIATIDCESFVLKMNRPRYVEAIPDGTLVIADTGNNRILATTGSGKLLWQISSIPDSPLNRLHQPRWATVVNRNEVVISDHFHHRVIHLRAVSRK
jgi:sugar lactone lactonase YvrE